MLHFYDGQIRKFLTQFIRILSNFSVETGRGKDDQIQKMLYNMLQELLVMLEN